MSLAVALAFNIIAMIALIGGLAHVMSRAKNLEPHTSNATAELFSMERGADEAQERIAA